MLPSRHKHAKINKIPSEKLHEILKRELGINTKWKRQVCNWQKT